MARRCPFYVERTPTIVGTRWMLYEGRTARRRFVDAASANTVQRAYCDAWLQGEPRIAVERRLGQRVPFKEPGRPAGYIIRFPGEG